VPGCCQARSAQSTWRNLVEFGSKQRYRPYYADEGILGFDTKDFGEACARKGGSMSVMDLFWLFFILSALQPVLRQRMLEAMRMRKIAQLERKRNSRVILLVRRQETMRLLGFPVMRHIEVNDSENVLRAIEMIDEEIPLDIVLHTPGGLVVAASQSARDSRPQGEGACVSAPAGSRSYPRMGAC
jgi:Serine dehydrogenase proteinase